MSTSSPLASELPSLPELAPLCRSLAQKLGWKRIVFLGSNPVLDLSGFEGGSDDLELIQLGSTDKLPGDLGETIVAVPATLELQGDEAFDHLAEALGDAGLGVICSTDRTLVGAAGPQGEWSYQELWDALEKRDAKPRWGTHTQSGGAWFERHHALVVTAVSDEVGEKVAGWLETGLASFSLSEAIAPGSDNPPRPSRVCICTDEIFGPSSNGGIGTAYTALAEGLAQAKQEVTVLFSGEITSHEPISHWIDFYKAKGIELVHLDLPRLDGLPWEDEYQRRSHEDYLWLKTREQNDGEDFFDVVHFPECNGKAFYSCLAKRQGLALQNTAICIGTHGNTKWVYEGHGAPLFSKFQLSTYFMEMHSSKWCDVLVSPSYFLVHWMKHHGWTMPRQWFIQQNIQPYTARGEDEKRTEPFPVKKAKEFVFFGRIEARKGVMVLCDALDLVGDLIAENDIEFTFMGKEVPILDTMSGPYLERRAKAGKWKFDWKIIGNFNQDKAVAYLREEGRVAVMPSLADNSPYTVLECIGMGTPFVSSRIGGIAELIDPEDLGQATYSHRQFGRLHKELAARLESVVENGIRPCRRQVSSTDNEDMWVRWHKSLVEHPVPKPEFLDAPVPAIHHLMLVDAADTPAWLEERYEISAEAKAASTALARWGETELKDEGLNLSKASFASDVTILEQGGGDAGAPDADLRRWLMGLDDDYVLLSEGNSLLSKETIEVLAPIVSRTGADLYSPLKNSQLRIFEDWTDVPRTFYPVGPVPLLPTVANAYPGGVLLVKASVLLEILPAPGEGFGLAQISALIAKAVVNGFNYEVVPEALYLCRRGGEYPRTPDAVCAETPPAEVLGVFDRAMPSWLQMMYNFDDKSAGKPDQSDPLMEEYWSLRYAVQDGYREVQEARERAETELGEMVSKHDDQTAWLGEREKIIETNQAELAQAWEEVAKQKKALEKAKAQIRERDLEKKVVEKENEHLRYRVERRLGTRLKQSFGKRKNS